MVYFRSEYAESLYRRLCGEEDYLKENFSNKEIAAFLILLSTFEKAVSIFPKMYPIINKKEKIRRAVLSKELSAFYIVSRKHIEVLALIDNRSEYRNGYS